MEQISLRTDFLKYVSFNVIGMIGLSCYILADTFFVAQGIGAEGLTALNLAIPVYSFINGTGLMIGMGGATRFSISKNDQVFVQAVYYTAIMACIFVAAGIFFADPIAAILGADIYTLQNTSIYLKVILCFAPMFMLNNVMLCFIRNDGNPKLSMTAMLAGSFSNIILDYIFVFPLQMGMFGAALATGIAPVISLMMLSVHFLKKKNTFQLMRLKPQRHAMADMTSLGISALITELSSGIVIIIFNNMILNLSGNIGVAAYGIIANIALVIVAIFNGISQGMQPIISRLYCAKNRIGTNKILKYGLLTAVFIAVIVYVVSLCFAPEIVGVFNKDSDALLAETAVNGLIIYFTAFAFVGINILCAAYFSAVDHPKNAFIISILRGFVVIIPTAFTLSTFFGINGVWSAMTVTEFTVFLVSAGMLKKVSVRQACREEQKGEQ